MDCQSPPLENQVKSQERIIIRKVQDNSLTYFTDPKSPYHRMPQKLKQYMIKSINLNHIANDAEYSKLFVAKPGKTCMCTRFFLPGTQFYTCRQCCCQTKIGTTMCFCQSCWVPQKHIGHNFSKRSSSGTAYCDCGRQSRIKPQSFCDQHSQQGKRFIEIPQQQRTKFKQLFMPLLISYLYLKVNNCDQTLQSNLQVFINKKLEQLCIGSLYYIKLTSELLLQKIRIDQKQLTILQWFLLKNETCERLLFAMIADDQFKFEVINSTNRMLQNQQQYSHYTFRFLTSQFYERDSIFYIFAENGKFIKNQGKRYIQIANNSKKGVKLLLDYLIFYQKQQRQNKQFLTFLTKLFNEKDYPTLISNRQIAEKILQLILQLKESWSKQNCIDIITLASVCIFSLCDSDPKKILQFYNNSSNQAYFQNLQSFINYVFDYSRTYVLQSRNRQGWFVVMLLMIQNLPKVQQYIKIIWKSLTRKNTDQREELNETFSLIHHLVSIIAASMSHFNQYSVNKIKDEKSQLQLQNWMKSYLYQNNKIPRNELLQLRQKGSFKFANAGTKLKQLCKYVEGQDLFEYVSEQKYPNYLMRFKINRAIRQPRTISSNNFRLSEKFVYQGPQYIGQILFKIFNSQDFYKEISTLWQQRLQSIKQNHELALFYKNNQLGFYYVLTLVYALCFSRFKNIQVLQQIQKIKNDQNYRNIFINLCQDRKKIHNLLQIQQIEENINSQNINKDENKKQQQIKAQQQSPQRRQKSQEQINQTPNQKRGLLKQKLQMKMQKYRENAFKFIKQIEPSQNNQNQQCCIICREHSTANNKLMYISWLQKNGSMAYVFYGTQDKSQYLIKTCFHLLHYNCFININKSGFDFNCPLCTKRSNIYLPFQGGDRKTLKRCSNLVNAIQVSKFKNHDFQSLSLVILKYLVGGYGLNSILLNSYNKNQKQNIKKVDRIMLKMVLQEFSLFNQMQKHQYQSYRKQLIQVINSCKKQALRIVQAFFTNLLFNKLLNKQQVYNQKQLAQLQAKMDPIQFECIRQNIQQILGYKINLNKLQKFQYTGQKLNIGIKFLYPPKLLDEFQSFYSKTCQTCKNANTRYVCLLCKMSLCQNCLIGNIHNLEHNSNFIALEVNNKKVYIKQTGSRSNGFHNIYFDPFITSYQDSQKYKSQQTYQLNLEKMQKLFKLYIGRS